MGMGSKPLLKLTAILTAVMLCIMAAVAVCSAQESDSYIQHTVKSGENLSLIAKKYGVTLDEIVRLNNIENANLITVGTVLTIPAVQSQTGTAAAADVKQPEAQPKAQNEFTDTATAERPASPATGTATKQDTAEKPSDGDYSTMLTSFETKVSVTFVNTDLRDALSAFALNMGYNIIYKGEPTKITMTLKDVTIAEALDYMMKLTDLAYIITDNTIIVGSKGELTASFSEAAKITEFTLKYVTSDTIIGQISKFNIAVNATPSGDNEYRFLAQGLPADLARVRNLISMVDRRENAPGGGSIPESAFYSIELANITAAEFQRVLSAASLPSGVILSSRPQTLYIFALPNEYNSIKSIKAIVDVADQKQVDDDTEKIVEKTLKFVTVDLIEAQIRANAEVTIIKISTNSSKMWLKGKAKGIADAEKIIALLDIKENAAATEEQLIERFTPVTTQFITAAMLKDTLSKLAIDAVTIVYESNPKTLYVFATDETLAKILNLIKIIDTEENAGVKVEEVLALFKPVSCTYISAEQLNEVLSSMSLPTGLIFEDNPKTLYVYATESDFAKIKELLKIVDVKDNENSVLAASIKSVTCRYITAEQLNTMLKGMSLPTGLYYDYNPYVLYLNVNEAQLREIQEVAAYVDTLENSRAGSFSIYFIDLFYINVDRAVEFIGQLNLDLNVVRLSSSQKRLWVMGEYSEFIKAKSAISSIDLPNASLTGSFSTFVLNHITAGEAKRLIDNAKLTGVQVYIPNGNDTGNEIVIYYPNDSYYDIRNIVNKIDSATTYKMIIETLVSSGDPDFARQRISMLSSLSGVDYDYFDNYTYTNEAGEECVVIYVDGVTMLDYNKIMTVVEMLK